MTSDGYEADPDEVEALVNGLLDEEDLSDPTLMYVRATKQQVLHAAVAERLGQLRSEAVSRLSADMSYRSIASHLGLSLARVQQLLARRG